MTTNPLIKKIIRMKIAKRSVKPEIWFCKQV